MYVNILHHHLPIRSALIGAVSGAAMAVAMSGTVLAQTTTDPSLPDSTISADADQQLQERRAYLEDAVRALELAGIESPTTATLREEISQIEAALTEAEGAPEDAPRNAAEALTRAATEAPEQAQDALGRALENVNASGDATAGSTAGSDRDRASGSDRGGNGGSSGDRGGDRGGRS